jgi:hypothetical protein
VSLVPDRQALANRSEAAVTRREIRGALVFLIGL